MKCFNMGVSQSDLYLQKVILAAVEWVWAVVNKHMWMWEDYLGGNGPGERQ